jgi:hypothetical protein
MVDSAGQEIGDCFLAAVWVVGEAGAGGDRKVVKQEKGGQVAEFGGANGAAHNGSDTFGLFAREDGGAD